MSQALGFGRRHSPLVNRATRDPLDLFNKSEEYPGAAAYEVYSAGAEELLYHLKNNPVQVKACRMFAYNYMVTTVRAISQELDNFTAEFATAIEHAYVDNRSISEEIADAFQQVQRQLLPENELV